MTVMPSSSRPPRSLAVAQRPLLVCSIDAEFMTALQASGFKARVHSVFDRVINLERASGELVTLAARGMDNAPLTAIVDIPNFAAAGIAVDDAVAAIDQALHVGDRLVLNFAAAPVWRARLPSYAPAPSRLPGQLAAARRYLVQQGVRGGMSPQAGAEGAFASEVAVALEQRSAWLLDALLHSRPTEACRHAVSMLGLGPGLTPSGDDFLVGLFAVLNLTGSPCQGWLDGGALLLLHAEHATNAISRAALTAAAAGRVRESIAALIDALLHGTPTTLVQPLRRVLVIGATSGADMVAGVLAGLELNLQVEAKRSVESSPLLMRASPAAAVFQPISTGASWACPSKR